MTIDVLKPGALTTFQDLGRFGLQHEGIPVCGAMDERSHRLACMLVGNTSSEATLEVTWIGPSLSFQTSVVVAICGADLGATISGRPLPVDTPIVVKAGETIAFGKRLSGLRAYLAVAGGYQLEPVLGSTSTYVRAGIGGRHGRPLTKGDCIPLAKPRIDCPDATLPVYPQEIARPSGSPLRLVAGREFSAFEPSAPKLLSETAYRVSARSDRMGCRLEGATLLLTKPLELQSEAVSFGTVQVPPDGMPIVLMADRQTTGGYPRIANVASVDLHRLAQAMAGDVLTFEWISLDEAQRLAILQTAVFKQMEPCHGID